MTTKSDLIGFPVHRRESIQIKLVGQSRHAGQDVTEIPVGIVAVALTGDHDRVDDRGALAGIRMADEEEVFLPDRGGPDGVLDQVIVEAGLSMPQVRRQRLPVAQEVVAGLPKERLRPDSLAVDGGQLPKQKERFAKPFLAQLGSPGRLIDPGLVPLPLESVHPGNQLEGDLCCLRRLGLGLVKLAPGMRRMESFPYGPRQAEVF